MKYFQSCCPPMPLPWPRPCPHRTPFTPQNIYLNESHRTLIRFIIILEKVTSTKIFLIRSAYITFNVYLALVGVANLRHRMKHRRINKTAKKIKSANFVASKRFNPLPSEWTFFHFCCSLLLCLKRSWYTFGRCVISLCSALASSSSFPKMVFCFCVLLATYNDN